MPGPLPPRADGAGDAVFLNLRVAVVHDAQRLGFRPIEGFEELVKEADVPARHIEAGRIRPEKAFVFFTLRRDRSLLPPLFQQFLGARAFVHRLGGREDLAELRETQPEHPFFGEHGTEDRQDGDHAKQEQDDAVSIHFSFQTLRYSCRAHISSR